ncbi:STAS domain-containing protein [Ruegeria profundi]|nr:STAS domain-containing protein [Ruegeria profundi]MCA0928101.1 STAS domain-containing protein [Ruegeria profundi]
MSKPVRTYELTQSEASGDTGPMVEFLQIGAIQPVSIDCSDLRHIPTRCLQILLAARRHWAEAEQSFILTGVGDECRHALRTLGVSETTFQFEGI